MDARCHRVEQALQRYGLYGGIADLHGAGNPIELGLNLVESV